MEPTAAQDQPAGVVDAALVASALDGDRAALGEIYERYADRVHTMCVHMLGDRHEAADVCGEVFLVAFQRLAQLREPAKLKPWLFAIARHEVYRRTTQRRRIDLIEEVDEMDGMTDGNDEVDERTVDPAALVRVLRDASAGLDDRDRLVMELQLQGLDGDDLAAALGTSTSTAYQHVHRMKERLERSIGAVLVARQGREECEQLDRVLRDWDGTFSVLWRKRVARHVDSCEICERRRKAVPAALLGGVAVAAPMLGASAVSAAPASVRTRVLSEAQVGAAGSAASADGWGADGFPPAGLPAGDDVDRGADGTGRSSAVLVVLAAILVLLALGGVLGWLLLAGEDQELTTAQATSDTVVTTTVPPTTTPPSVETVPVPTSAPDTGATSTTVAVVPPADRPIEVPGDVPDASPVPGPPDEGTTAPPVAPVPPEVQILVAPGAVYHPTAGFPDCGASTRFVVAAPTATAVALRWSGSGRTGSAPLVRQGAEWVGVLEVPADVAGPLDVRALAVDSAGTQGLSAPLTRPVELCPTPG